MRTPSSGFLSEGQKHPEIQFQQRPDLSSYDLGLNIFRKYGTANIPGPLFEKIIPNCNGGSNNPNYYSLVRNFPARKLIVFFEEDEIVFEFNSFADFVDIFYGSGFFTAYVTDADLSFIVCCTEEETLVVAGEAGNWL